MSAELSVVLGSPTPEELAAVVAVLRSRRASRLFLPAPVPDSVSAWAEPAARMRPVVEHGPGAWQRSSLPH
jgi:hypothetical protein